MGRLEAGPSRASPPPPSRARRPSRAHASSPCLLQSLIQGSTFFLGGDRGPVTRSSWTIDLWSSCGERKRNGPQPPRRSTSRHSLREDPASSSMRPSPVQAGFKSAGPATAPSPWSSPWSWPPQSDVGVGGNLSRPDFTPSFLPLCMTALDDRSAAMSPALDVVSPPREPRPRKPSFPPIPSHHPSLMISFARVTHAFQHVSQVPGDDRGGIVSYRKDCNVFARFRGGERNRHDVDRSCDVGGTKPSRAASPEGEPRTPLTTDTSGIVTPAADLPCQPLQREAHRVAPTRRAIVCPNHEFHSVTSTSKLCTRVQTT